MKKYLLITAFTLATIFNATGQEWEYGLVVGPSHYQGDLSKAQITLRKTRVQGGAFMRLGLNPNLALRAGLYYGRLAGSDADWGRKFDGGANFSATYKTFDNTHNYYWRKKRNLSFTSNIAELSIQLEYNIFKFIPNSIGYKWSPYIVVGVAGFYFNPKAELDGNSYSLAKYRTEYEKVARIESKGKGYSLFNIALPTGIGVKYNLMEDVTLSFEIVGRKTFTDYLDDVHHNYPYNGPGDIRQVIPGSVDARLANRTAEATDPKGNPFKAYDFSTPPAGGNEARRGDPKQFDSFVFSGFTISKIIRKRIPQD